MPSRREQESNALLSTFNGFQGCFTYETVQIRGFLDSLVGKTSTFLYKPTGRENLGGSVTSLIQILFHNSFPQKVTNCYVCYVHYKQPSNVMKSTFGLCFGGTSYP